MRLHRLLGIHGASRLETTSDKMIPDRPKQSAIAADHDRVVKHDRHLLVRRSRPVAKRSDREDRRRNENNSLPSLYGWPQCANCAFSEFRAFASFMTQTGKIQAPTAAAAMENSRRENAKVSGRPELSLDG